MRIFKIIFSKLLFVSTLVFWNCDSSSLVPFDELCSYMEVSQDGNNTLVFRSFKKPNSFQKIVKANLTEKISNGQRNMYLTLLYGSYQSNEKDTAIKEMPWGGIKIIFSGEYDFKNNKFYYVDKNGKHKIKCGTSDSWKKKVEEMIEQNNIEKGLRSKILSEI
jgi:hypothetical protein